MVKDLDKYEKFKIYRKVMSECDIVLSKDNIEKAPEEFIENPAVDDEVPGFIKSKNPKIQALYDKLMAKYEPSTLIFDNKKE